MTVVVRPENLKADGSGRNRLGTVRVREATFQGAHYRVLAKSDVADQDFVLRLPPDRPVEQGMQVQLSYDLDHMVAVDR